MILTALLFVLAAADAPITANAATETSSNDFCATGPWSLDGATWDTGPEATYREAWTPTLTSIARCEPMLKSTGKCVEVQGQFDDIPFAGAAVVRAFGSKEAAQQARARGRASAVLKHLDDLGIDGILLRERAPGDTATYRGAQVRFVDGCGTDLAALEQRYSEVVARELARLQEQEGNRASSDVETRVAAEVQRLKAEEAAASPHVIWLAGGIDLSAMWIAPRADDDGAFGSVLHLGGGWHNDIAYAQANLGAGVGAPAAQRVAFDATASAGYYGSKLVQVGLLVAYRAGSPAISSPWAERTWAVGVEGTQCIDATARLGIDAELCLRESLLPFGGHLRRARVNDGELERIPAESHAALRFDVGAIVRYRLF